MLLACLARTQHLQSAFELLHACMVQSEGDRCRQLVGAYNNTFPVSRIVSSTASLGIVRTAGQAPAVWSAWTCCHKQHPRLKTGYHGGSSAKPAAAGWRRADHLVRRQRQRRVLGLGEGALQAGHRDQVSTQLWTLYFADLTHSSKLTGSHRRLLQPYHSGLNAWTAMRECGSYTAQADHPPRLASKACSATGVGP